MFQLRQAWRSLVRRPAYTAASIGTLALVIGVNAALFAVSILANSRPELRKKLHEFREAQEKKIRETTL